MDLQPTETQLMLQETARRLVRERYGFEERQRILASPDGHSPGMWRTFAKLGLLGIEIEERFGGSGGSVRDLAVVIEAFGSELVVEPYLPTVVLGAGLVAAAGNEAQKAAILPKVVAGDMKLALAHGEPGARYSLNHVETTAEGHVINGRKMVVLGGGAADLLIVSARSAGAAADRDGISLYLLDPATAGVRRRSYRTVDDLGAAEIVLEDVRLPEDALLGPAGGGLDLVEAAVDRGIAALSCEAVGVMAALNELTLDYIKTRVQFGRPIGKFQVLQHRMADMMIAEEQARSVALLAAERANDRDPRARAQAACAAKVQVGRSAQVVGRGSIQLHGGMGMTVEYRASHYFKRLTAFENTFGDIDHHLARFAAL